MNSTQLLPYDQIRNLIFSLNLFTFLKVKLCRHSLFSIPVPKVHREMRKRYVRFLKWSIVFHKAIMFFLQRANIFLLKHDCICEMVLLGTRNRNFPEIIFTNHLSLLGLDCLSN